MVKAEWTLVEEREVSFSGETKADYPFTTCSLCNIMSVWRET